MSDKEQGIGRPLWLIAKRDDGRMDVLTLGPEENGEEGGVAGL